MNAVARSGWQPWVTLLARLVLAAVMFAASIPKLVDVDASAKAIYAYQIFPTAVSDLIAYALPVVELLLAVTMLLSIFLRPAAAVYALLMLVFIAGIASVWARGLKIDCGCFGGGGKTENPHYLREILRDTGLAVLATWVLLFPRSRFALLPRRAADERTYRSDVAHDDDHDLADHDLADYDLADHDLADHDLADHDLDDYDETDAGKRAASGER